MLNNTFIHLPGISLKRERQLWEQGIMTWEQLDEFHSEFGSPRQLDFFGHRAGNRKGRLSLREALDESREALCKGDTDYFASKLKPNEHYRIALTFPSKTAFLDIETTGLSHYYDTTTLVGVSMGDEFQIALKGGSSERLRSFLEEAKCLVTFNGKIFDLRFLRKDYPQLNLPKSHVDLRFFSRRAGFSGGQKSIEKTLGIDRLSGISDMTGKDAPLLWHEYKLGDVESAKRMIMYNHADVEGMKFILDSVIGKVCKDDLALGSFVDHKFSEKLSKIHWDLESLPSEKKSVFVQAYRGKKGLEIVYEDLVWDERSRNLRVVGIDLTGSEKRPTGWSFLEGNCVHTQQIRSDKDLIEETKNCKPDLISIDSPLSIPKGRTRETDDDPYREQFGIMRECERTLKKRGVNVYPSLIPSMQKLTARGRRLASDFRKLGFPVIESYPGAAQDIMGIPRKQKGLSHLTKGLGDFGIRGEFLSNEVSHDELDAITSAVVGVFFWSGKYEALGNEDEDYLIIPDMTRKKRASLEVIGLSGCIAAGKTTAAKFLEKEGYSYARYSQVLKSILEKDGKDVNRESLQKLGFEMNKKIGGQRSLGEMMIREIGDEERIVIDGLRFLEDYAFLVEKFGPAFKHVFIHAEEDIRRGRYKKRNNEDDTGDAFEHEVEREIVELSRIPHTRVENSVEGKSGFCDDFMEILKK